MATFTLQRNQSKSSVILRTGEINDIGVKGCMNFLVATQLESRLANLKVEEHSKFGHFWKAHDQTNPTRYGTKCITGTTHIINFFLKFSSIKQAAPSSEN